MKFHDTRLSEAVDAGFHVLYIDERREAFRPTLWTRKEGSTQNSNQIVEQVWFAGCHADVGGGYREAALSDISLKWMIERVGAASGLAFDLGKLAALRPDPLGPQHVPPPGLRFILDRLLPCLRLIKQTADSIPSWRRALVGTWRTGKLRSGDVTVNEEIHPASLSATAGGSSSNQPKLLAL